MQRYTCLCTGSKHERVINPGVSSTSTSTPVARSNARILRPSFPIIFPFYSLVWYCDRRSHHIRSNCVTKSMNRTGKDLLCFLLKCFTTKRSTSANAPQDQRPLSRSIRAMRAPLASSFERLANALKFFIGLCLSFVDTSFDRVHLFHSSLICSTSRSRSC